MPALQIRMSRRVELNRSNAALTESKEARSTFMKITSTPGTALLTSAMTSAARFSSRPVKKILSG